MLSKQDKNVLERHRPELVEEIDPNSLFPQLRKYGLVTNEQEAKIKGNGMTARDDQVQQILDSILRSREGAFDDFCKSLEASEQKRIVDDYLKPAVKRETGTKDLKDTSTVTMMTMPSPKKFKKSPSASTLARQFQPTWKEEFPWVKYNDAANTMYCELCKQKGKEGVWANSGTSNFRRKTIADHEMSREHQNSVETAQQPSNIVAWEGRQQDICSALRVCLTVMTEDLHDIKFQSFLKLRQDGENVPFDLSGKFYQLVESLNDVIDGHVRSEIHQSPHIGVRLDEWVDSTGGKHLIISARYVSSTVQVKTAFLRCISGYDGQTSSIQTAVRDIATDYQIPLTRIVGLGTDCASAMTNKLHGVTELLSEHNPHMVFLHCVCHRLNLAISQVCDGVPSMAVLQSIVANAYIFISTGRDRLEYVHNMTDVWKLENVRVQHLYDVGWLKHDSIDALLLDYKPFMSLVQREAALGDPTALGLNIQLSKYIYVALLHFVADILSTNGHINTQFNDVDFSTICQKVKDCDDSLNSLHSSDGKNMAMFESLLQQTGSYKGVGLDGDGDFKLSFQGVRKQVLQNLQRNLHRRLHLVELLGAMQIFQPSAYPEETGNRLKYWGIEHLQTVLKHYGSRLENADGKSFDAHVDRDSCDGEFLTFKRTAHPSLRDKATLQHLRPVELMQKIFLAPKGHPNNRRIFQDMYKLMTACVCAQAGDAQVDRVFSCLHQMKPWLETKVTTEQLNQLISRLL